MLIIALVLAVIGLAALVTAVVTSNELIAWVCIGASVVGVVLLIVDAVRDRSRGERTDADDPDDETQQFDEHYPDDTVDESTPEAEPVAEQDPAADPITDADARAGVAADDDADAVPFDERHEDRKTP